MFFATSRNLAVMGMGVTDTLTRMSRGDPSGKIIDMSVALIILSVVGVLAIGYLITANTTGWSAGQVSLFQIVITFAILGFALLILYGMIGRGRKR